MQLMPGLTVTHPWHVRRVELFILLLLAGGIITSVHPSQEGNQFDIKILKSKLGANAGAIGAALLVNNQ